jgi:hypothetical protein
LPRLECVNVVIDDQNPGPDPCCIVRYRHKQCDLLPV